MREIVTAGLLAGHWYAFGEKSQWWMVFIGLCTLLIIAYQARETANATKAMKDSIRLQEVGLRQWVNLENWESYVTGKNPYTLVIEFSIVNPTSVPLKLDAVLTTLPGGHKTDIAVNSLLAPDNPYVVTVSLSMDLEQRNEYSCASGIPVTIQGSVLFRDALNGKWEQGFARTLMCASDGVTVVETKNKLRSSDLVPARSKL